MPHTPKNSIFVLLIVANDFSVFRLLPPDFGSMYVQDLFFALVLSCSCVGWTEPDLRSFEKVYNV